MDYQTKKRFKQAIYETIEYYKSEDFCKEIIKDLFELDCEYEIEFDELTNDDFEKAFNKFDNIYRNGSNSGDWLINVDALVSFSERHLSDILDVVEIDKNTYGYSYEFDLIDSFKEIKNKNNISLKDFILNSEVPCFILTLLAYYACDSVVHHVIDIYMDRK